MRLPKPQTFVLPNIRLGLMNVANLQQWPPGQGDCLVFPLTPLLAPLLLAQSLLPHTRNKLLHFALLNVLSKTRKQARLPTRVGTAPADGLNMSVSARIILPLILLLPVTTRSPLPTSNMSCLSLLMLKSRSRQWLPTPTAGTILFLTLAARHIMGSRRARETIPYTELDNLSSLGEATFA